MRRNLSHIIAAAFNEPLLLEPAYARVFFCALGREMGAASLSVPQQQVQLDAPGMLAETDEYMAGGKRPARVYRVVNGIAVLPVEALTGYLYEIQYSADGWQTSVGLIAQDAQKALPELVTEDADVISGEKRLRLNYNGIIALLVEGFKTLRHEIKELREK